MIDPDLQTALRTRLAALLAPPTERHHPLIVDGDALGWLDDRRVAALERFPAVFTLAADGLRFAPSLADPKARSAAMHEVAQSLSRAGELTAWRDEAFAVAPAFGAPPAFLLERAAARWFGIVTYAAHVNGFVPHHGELGMWLARRSPRKPIDPGLLDNLVGGGVRAGDTIAATVTREAWEEAGIGTHDAARAQPVGVVRVVRALPDGLQREVIFVHDLRLSPAYTPAGVDGESIDHRLVTLGDAAALIAQGEGSERLTADASLVIVDAMVRHGALAPDSPHYEALADLRHASLQPPHTATRD